ncbi:MAG: glycosyl transferase [Paracoccus denitrificans]|uniref:Peptide O-xylosyltransferase n=1 Tax=Paracoccus denitrificans TaxID=266 RepID=A0A533IAC9_PARDE|nr:MAG: glycosyl transferase [Paracoccus denitrificans]
MAKIVFILLPHKDPDGLIAQAERLTAMGDFVSIHYDGNSPTADFNRIRANLGANPNVAFAGRRHRCGWGAWSLVTATLDAVRAAVAAFPSATHFYMLSGDCMPIKSAEYARAQLDAEHVDYIESFDFFGSDWIKTGMKDDRLIYRHWFNERSQPRRFYLSYELQKRFGLARKIPSDLQMMIGSQWWCLRRETIEKILDFADTRPDVMRFFSTTWIPDETFFQTIVRHVVPRHEIHSRTLTMLIFTDYGMPVVFHNDHYDMLLRQDYLFARKISPEALELKERLSALWQAQGMQFAISGEGKSLFRFLTARGRVGQRFAPRFWEAEATLGRQSRLLMVVAKKWHIAKRLTAAIRRHTDIPAVDYLFNERDAGLPDLGGAETTVAKRERHRRALIRLLMNEFDDSRLVICIDPSAFDLIGDFASDKGETRILFIDPSFDDDYLRGHIGRVGLANASTPPEVLARLLPAVRGDLLHEAERLREMEFENFTEISESHGLARNARAIAGFLEIDEDAASMIASTPHLFDD